MAPAIAWLMIGLLVGDGVGDGDGDGVGDAPEVDVGPGVFWVLPVEPLPDGSAPVEAGGFGSATAGGGGRFPRLAPGAKSTTRLALDAGCEQLFPEQWTGLQRETGVLSWPLLPTSQRWMRSMVMPSCVVAVVGGPPL